MFQFSEEKCPKIREYQFQKLKFKVTAYYFTNRLDLGRNDSTSNCQKFFIRINSKNINTFKMKLNTKF